MELQLLVFMFSFIICGLYCSPVPDLIKQDAYGCEDLYSDCFQYQSHCEDVSAKYHQFATKNCKNTCKIGCQKKYLTKQDAYGCEDLYSDCFQYQSHCNDVSAKYHQFATKNCKNTCKIGCQKKDLIKQDASGCEDLYSYCPYYKYHCDDVSAKKHQFATKYCKNTCKIGCQKKEWGKWPHKIDLIQQDAYGCEDLYYDCFYYKSHCDDVSAKYHQFVTKNCKNTCKIDCQKKDLVKQDAGPCHDIYERECPLHRDACHDKDAMYHQFATTNCHKTCKIGCLEKDLGKQDAGPCHDIYERECPLHRDACHDTDAAYHQFATTNCHKTCKIGCLSKDLAKQDAGPCHDIYARECPLHGDACHDPDAAYHQFATTNCHYTCKIGCLSKDLLKQDAGPCHDIYERECPLHRDACHDKDAAYHQFATTNCHYTCKIGCLSKDLAKQDAGPCHDIYDRECPLHRDACHDPDAAYHQFATTNCHYTCKIGCLSKDLVKQDAGPCHDIYERECPLHRDACHDKDAMYHQFATTNCHKTCKIGCLEKDLVKQDAGPCHDIYERECPLHQDACHDKDATYHQFATTNCHKTCKIGCLEKDLVRQDAGPCHDIYERECPLHRDACHDPDAVYHQFATTNCHKTCKIGCLEKDAFLVDALLDELYY